MIIGFDASRAFGTERGGSENYSYQLLKALLKIDKKNKYIIYTRGRAKGLYPSEGSALSKQANVWIKPISWPKLWTQGGLALATWKDSLDVLFVPAHTLPVLGKSGLPTVVTIHGLEYEYLPEHYKIPQKYYLTWSTRYAVKQASRLISVSEFTKSELVKRLGADPDKISVIHEGVDIQRFKKTYREKEKSEVLRSYGIRKPYVLFVGVIQPRKNLVRLIEAFSKVVNTRYDDENNVNPSVRSDARIYDFPNLRLVIAGKMGWMYEEILKAPKKYGVEDRVVFTGYVADQDLPIVLQEAQAYIQPSLTEGFGLPVLEAMAAGAPVISAKAGALPEVVGDAGLLVDPKSVEEMSEAMKLLARQRELGEGLREKAYKRIKDFTWEKAAKETIKVLEEAIKMS